MRTFTALIASAGLLLTAGLVRADDLGDKISRGAHATAKTIVHGAKAVGHGAAKVYHDTASDVHRQVAHNEDTQHAKAVQLKKAARERQAAKHESHVSHSQMHRAGDAASDVGR